MMDTNILLPILIYLACGACAGFLGGLLGIGGGVIIVAILVLVFQHQGIAPDQLYHLAIGTSLASIILTSISSAIAHYRRGAVRLDVLAKITPGVIIGTLAGSLVASYMPYQFLKVFIVCFLFFVGLNMLLNFLKPKPGQERSVPGVLGTSAVGSVIGAIASWVGVGGGTLSTPFMLYCGVPMIAAVGTSSAIGVPISLSGALGSMIGGWNETSLPPGTIGYVHVVAVITIASSSILMAPLGVRVAHALPVKTLRRVFGIFLLSMAFYLLWGLVAPFIS